MTRPLRIGINARALANPVGGVREVAHALIPALLEAAPQHAWSVYCYGPSTVPDDPRYVGVPACHKAWWDHRRLPRRMQADDLDVALFMQNVAPLRPPSAYVVVVHDMMYFPLPGLPVREYAWPDIFYMRSLMPRSIRGAAYVSADSEHTRKDILSVIPGVDPDRVCAVPLAASRHRTPGPPAETSATLARLGIQPPYFFYPASHTPRKNLETAIRALAGVAQEMPHRLVVTGTDESLQRRYGALLAETGLVDRVQAVGFLDTDDLPALYAGAEALVFPSRYEGFGIPPLEAFACDCPVIASNAASIPEVTGDAALLHDPMDVPALTDHLRRVAGDPTVRQELVRAGRARLPQFTWARTAERILGLLERAATENDRG